MLSEHAQIKYKYHALEFKDFIIHSGTILVQRKWNVEAVH